MALAKKAILAFAISAGFLNSGCLSRTMMKEPVAQEITPNLEKYTLEQASTAYFTLGKAAVLTNGKLNIYQSYELGVTTGEPWLTIPLNVSNGSVVSLLSCGAVVYDKNSNKLIFIITKEKFMAEELVKIEEFSLDREYTKLFVSGGLCALVNDNTGILRVLRVSEEYERENGGYTITYKTYDLGGYNIDKKAKIFGGQLSSIVVVEDKKISCYGHVSCAIPTDLGVEEVSAAALIFYDNTPTIFVLDTAGVMHTFEVKKW